jgi:uracil-DNA glycosylase family protein
MAVERSAADFLPPRINLTSLRRAADGCRGCDLYKDATQAVFGEGSRTSELVLVGETPGDQEDLQGRPFVGPAGRLLDEALEAAGVDRHAVYVTNAVKHFRFEKRDKRRLHKKPTARQIQACHPWLQAEFQVIEPRVVVCLGATAAQALIGKEFRITQQRGELLPGPPAEWVIATHHPSAILRAPEKSDRVRKRDELIDDLQIAATKLAGR